MDRSSANAEALRQALDGEAYAFDAREVAGATLRRLIVHHLMLGDARLAEEAARRLVPDDERPADAPHNGASARHS